MDIRVSFSETDVNSHKKWRGFNNSLSQRNCRQRVTNVGQNHTQKEGNSLFTLFL